MEEGTAIENGFVRQLPLFHPLSLSFSPALNLSYCLSSVRLPSVFASGHAACRRHAHRLAFFCGLSLQLKNCMKLVHPTSKIPHFSNRVLDPQVVRRNFQY